MFVKEYKVYRELFLLLFLMTTQYPNILLRWCCRLKCTKGGLLFKGTPVRFFSRVQRTYIVPNTLAVAKLESHIFWSLAKIFTTSFRDRNIKPNI